MLSTHYQSGYSERSSLTLSSMKVSTILVFTACIIFSMACGDSSATVSNVEVQTNANILAPSEIPDERLAAELNNIADEAQGKVGIHAVLLETGATVSVNADERFAMQSVVKVPISMAVLKQVDEGKLSLDQTITIDKDEFIRRGMHSPIRDKAEHSEGYLLSSRHELKDLIAFAVSESDGTAADVLQRVAGGAEGVQSYVDSLGIDSMKVRYTHKEFSNNSERQFENWATPKGAVELLSTINEASNKATENKVNQPLSKENADLLLKLMVETWTGPNRLKGLLPEGTPVAHKTGTSGTVDGVTAATNDVGIVTMPDGRKFIIAVFVGNSPADEKTREAVIAKSAKAVWDAWVK